MSKPNVAVMVDAPKRSVGETITQLVVIAILIAILIGAIIIFRQYVESHNTSGLISYRPTTTLSGRAPLISDVVYHWGLVTSRNHTNLSTLAPAFEIRRAA